MSTVGVKHHQMLIDGQWVDSDEIYEIRSPATEELVATVEHLKEENRALRQRHESLSTERASLLHKNEQVRTRVEAMIGRLKTMEHGA